MRFASSGCANVSHMSNPQRGVQPGAYTTLRFERGAGASGHVLVVTIDNPAGDLNVVDEALHADLTQLFGELRTEHLARAVLLTGSKRAFCAGGDFAWFRELRSVARLEALRKDAKRMIWDLLDVELPIVCALNGPAMGLGASIALLCDAIFMADTATIGDPHVRVGIVAGDGGTAIWPLALGPALAKRFLLTGDALQADEALRVGLITHVSSASSLFDDALAFADRLASSAPLALAYTKAAVNKLVKDALNVSFDVATGHELVTFLSQDHAEAMSALAEKRTPQFEGK